jgi:methyl-accepting chemotaxis protein
MKLSPTFPRVQALGRSGDDAQASSLYLARAARQYAAADKQLAALIAINDKVAAQLNRDIQATKASSLKLTLALILLALVLGTAVAYFVSRQIIGGVKQILTAAEGIAQGDLDQQVDGDSHHLSPPQPRGLTP